MSILANINYMYEAVCRIHIPGCRRFLFEANAVKRLGFKFPGFYWDSIRRGIQAYAVTPMELGAMGTLDSWGDGRFEELMKDSIDYHVGMELELMLEEVDVNDPEHRRRLDLWRSKALAFRVRAERSIRRIRPHGIVYFQGYYLEAAVLRALAIIHQIPLCAWENSFLKDRLLWDDKSGITVNRNRAHEFDQKYRGHASMEELVGFVGQTMSSIKDKKSREHSSPSDRKVLAFDQPVVLFIGQVYTDSSLMFGRDGFRDTVELVSALLAYCERNNYTLIAKLHPKEDSGKNPLGQDYDRLTWRKFGEHPELLAAFESGRHLCDYTNGFDTYGLIEVSNLVVTVNSQAGLEAAVLDKPVVVCGRSFYGQAGFVEFAPRPEVLENAANGALVNWSEIRHQRACEFFHTFIRRYCISNEKKAILEHLKELFAQNG